MSVNQVDVAKQIDRLVHFIQQEAAEKVEEIESKAEEEFNIEKSRLVSKQRVKVLEFYDKKEKQIELQRKIQHSNLANASRLSILKARDDYVQTLKEEAKKQLIFFIEDRAKYITILANLITQSLFRIMESTVTIRCRQDDYGLVQRLIPNAIQIYQKQLRNKDIVVTVDREIFLQDQIIGGIEVYALEGKIKVSNTIDDRLTLIFDQILPDIRKTLFGLNANRKYED